MAYGATFSSLVMGAATRFEGGQARRPSHRVAKDEGLSVVLGTVLTTDRVSRGGLRSAGGFLSRIVPPCCCAVFCRPLYSFTALALAIPSRTTSPTGELILNVLGSIAQFERQIMLEPQRRCTARGWVWLPS
jgi:hypothetical protein